MLVLLLCVCTVHMQFLSIHVTSLSRSLSVWELNKLCGNLHTAIDYDDDDDGINCLSRGTCQITEIFIQLLELTCSVFFPLLLIVDVIVILLGILLCIPFQSEQEKFIKKRTSSPHHYHTLIAEWNGYVHWLIIKYQY